MRTECGDCSRTLSRSSAPVMPGILISVTTASNVWFANARSASSALETNCISHTDRMGRNTRCRPIKRFGSSSTKRIRLCKSDLPSDLQRKAHVERCTSADFGVKPYPAAVLLDNYRMRQHESLTRSFANLFGREEWIEHSFPDLVGNSGAGVGYAKLHPFAVPAGRQEDGS